MDVVPQFIPLMPDYLSLFFTGIILLVSIPAAVHAVGYFRGHYPVNRIRLAFTLLISFILLMIAVVTATNALVFLIVWELMSLVSYFLVVFDCEENRSVRAGLIYIVMTHIGTAFITAAFLIIYSHAGSFEFSAFKAACLALPSPTKNLLFFLFFIGFGTKAGMIPLHIWLPYAHPQAPSPVSAIMSGVMIKTAIYGMIRFIICVLGVDAWWWGNVILVIASVSCLGGVIYALMEHDIKKLLAYHSVENIGIILLGVGACMIFMKKGMPIPAVLALTAGLYHTLNHAIFKSLLFLGAGNVYKATGLRNIEKMGGLIKTMPWTAATFLFGAMAISALPPLNGFVSEWLTLQAFFTGALAGTNSMKMLMALYASALALTGGLAAACFVKVFGISFLAMPRSKKAEDAKEVSGSMLGPVIFLAACTVIFGLAAVPVIKIISAVASQAAGINIEGVSFSLNNVSLAPLSGSGIAVSPLVIAGLLALIAAAMYAGIRIFTGKREVAAGSTWGCGYYNLGSRTEYTSTAFSKPFRIVFSFILRPYKKTEKIKETHYHVKSMRYEVYTTPVIKEYLYRSTFNFVMRTAGILRRLQAGQIHLYITYIIITLFLLIVFL